jgi:hypothetical protein
MTPMSSNHLPSMSRMPEPKRRRRRIRKRWKLQSTTKVNHNVHKCKRRYMDSAPPVSRHGSGRTSATTSTVMLAHWSRYSTSDWLTKQRRRARHTPSNGKHQPLRGRSRTARRVWRSTRAMSRTSQCNVPPSLPQLQLWVSNHILNRRPARRLNLKKIIRHTNIRWGLMRLMTLMMSII